MDAANLMQKYNYLLGMVLFFPLDYGKSLGTVYHWVHRIMKNMHTYTDFTFTHVYLLYVGTYVNTNEHMHLRFACTNDICDLNWFDHLITLFYSVVYRWQRYWWDHCASTSSNLGYEPESQRLSTCLQTGSECISNLVLRWILKLLNCHSLGYTACKRNPYLTFGIMCHFSLAGPRS